MLSSAGDTENKLHSVAPHLLSFIKEQVEKKKRWRWDGGVDRYCYKLRKTRRKKSMVDQEWVEDR